MAESFDVAERQPGIRRTVIILLVVICVLVGLFVNRVLAPRILSPKEMAASGAVMFSTQRQLTPFTLTDQNEQPFTAERFNGKWTFVFFGFTYCPDICPTTLVLFNELAEKLKDTEFADDTQFLLVSLDPQRDTSSQLKNYVEHFNPEFVGVTGEFLQLHRLSQELNVAFRKVVLDHETGDYTIDHGGNVALINPQGFYHGFYKPPLEANKMFLTYRSERMRLQ